MVQDHLNVAVMQRLQELGLPSSLIDIAGFRDKFICHHWVMFVRDCDKIVDVHLVQPQQPRKSLRRR
jgi:hypothetical protein